MELELSFSPGADLVSLLACLSEERVAGEAWIVLNLFFSGCEVAAAVRREFDVVCFLRVPVLADCDKDPGLSRVAVGLLRLEREVVGLSTPDLWEETVAVEVLRPIVGPVARDDIGVTRPVFSRGAVVREDVVVFRFDFSPPPMARDDIFVFLSERSAGVARGVVKVLRSGLSPVVVARDEVGALRSGLSASA